MSELRMRATKIEWPMTVQEITTSSSHAHSNRGWERSHSFQRQLLQRPRYSRLGFHFAYICDRAFHNALPISALLIEFALVWPPFSSPGGARGTS